jgi:hypothetical protein
MRERERERVGRNKKEWAGDGPSERYFNLEKMGKCVSV